MKECVLLVCLYEREGIKRVVDVLYIFALYSDENFRTKLSMANDSEILCDFEYLCTYFVLYKFKM